MAPRPQLKYLRSEHADFKFAERAQEKIEVRSSVGINIDPSLTAGVLRSRIDDDQSCVEFFFRIMLRVVQNDNLQTLFDGCPKGDDLLVAKNAKIVNMRMILFENRKHYCEKAEYVNKNGLFVLPLVRIRKKSVDWAENIENRPI